MRRVRDLDKQRAIDHYERLSRDYDGIVGRGPLGRLRARERNAVLAYARFEDRSKSTAIDVGCGGGFFALAAKRAGLKVAAVDAAPGMVRRLVGRVDEAWVADVESLVTGRTWDIVVCAGVLEFVLQPWTAFANLAALVAPRGRLVVCAPRAGPTGWAYVLEKRCTGFAVNLIPLEWFREAGAANGLVLRAWTHPLPTNRALLFERAGRLRAT